MEDVTVWRDSKFSKVRLVKEVDTTKLGNSPFIGVFLNPQDNHAAPLVQRMPPMVTDVWEQDVLAYWAAVTHGYPVDTMKVNGVEQQGINLTPDRVAKFREFAPRAAILNAKFLRIAIEAATDGATVLTPYSFMLSAGCQPKKSEPVLKAMQVNGWLTPSPTNVVWVHSEVKLAIPVEKALTLVVQLELQNKNLK